MEMFLKAHQFEILYTNLQACDKFNFGGRVYQGTVIEWLETLLQKARQAKEKGRYYHLFVYFSGHGRMREDTRETCGVDTYGDLIPFELYSKRFSQLHNVLSIFFLDCSREKLNA